MNADYVNKALSASLTTLKNFNINPSVDKPRMDNVKDKNIVNIIINIFGDISGQIILSTNHETGCELANNMLNGIMHIETIDDIGKSALAELGNIIAGNTATNLSNIGISVSITTPNVDINSFLTNEKLLCVPINFDKNIIDFYINLK